MRIRFDPQKCTGCQACQMACMDQNDIRPENNESPLRYVVLQEREQTIAYRCVGCIHCGKCMDACPVQAMERDELGVIQLHGEKCVGCGSCVEVCPLHVITIQDGKALKCDGCADRIQAGLLPACVHTCPTGALTLE